MFSGEADTDPPRWIFDNDYFRSSAGNKQILKALARNHEYLANNHIEYFAYFPFRFGNQ